MKRRLLIVDDDRDMCAELEHALSRRGCEAVAVSSGAEALRLFAEESFDAVITDLRMPGMTGVELCTRLVENRRDVPVIVITAFGSLETAIATLRAGATDLVPKPFAIEHLTMAIERALENRDLRDEVRRLREKVGALARSSAIVGESPAMREVFDMIARISASDATTLITGETGTGKELVAHAIHEGSARSAGPFVAINCAAMPEALLESELFGHVRGAFTDAKSARQGLLAEASGGTLFLDEVGEMPIAMQAKLLRVLEQQKVRPVGANAEIDIDVRVVAATHRDLPTAVEEGRFREDLYYRVNVVHVELPPLRSRGNDVLLLAQAFVGRIAAKRGRPVLGLSSDVAKKLLAYPWPGNVRELQNAMERAVALARAEVITVDDLPPKVRDYQRSHVLVAADDPGELVTLEEVERRYIRRVMEAVAWSKTEATRVLGIDRSTLYRKLERYKLAPPGDESR